MKLSAITAHILRSTIVPLIVGLAAGLVGALTAESYLIPKTPSIEPTLQFARPPGAVTAPLPETEVVARLKGMNVLLYPKKAGRVGETVERVVLPGEAAGRAVVITSDGWLLTHQSVISGGVLAGVRGKLVEPSKTVIDPRTGAVFLKIEAGALPVSSFEETETLRPGSPLYAEGGGRFVKSFYAGAAAIDRKGRTEALRSSDRFDLAYRFGPLPGLAALGGAVITAGGNLAGVLVPDAKADGGQAVFIPMHLLRPVLSDVFRNQPLRRATFGVRYLDLENAVVSGEALEHPQGARLTGSRKDGIPAVSPRSAAAASGLQEGDVILRVEDAEISGGRDLAEVIAEYHPGDKIKIEALRHGERKVFEVALD